MTVVCSYTGLVYRASSGNGKVHGAYVKSNYSVGSRVVVRI